MACDGSAESTASVRMRRPPEGRSEPFHPGARFSSLTTRWSRSQTRSLDAVSGNPRYLWGKAANGQPKMAARELASPSGTWMGTNADLAKLIARPVAREKDSRRQRARRSWASSARRSRSVSSAY
jgi:hypothetical protein